MKKTIFWFSLFCSAITAFFIWSKISLNGFRADIYFFFLVLGLNIGTFLVNYKSPLSRRRSFISLTLAFIQVIGLIIFISKNSINAYSLSNGWLTKSNLYSVDLAGFYRKQYFLPHKEMGCKDGKYWMTKIYIDFPLIEIEVERDNCYQKDGGWSIYKPE